MEWGADAAVEKGLRTVDWLGRLQRLNHGPVVADAPEDAEIWPDGGQQPALRRRGVGAPSPIWRKNQDRPLYLICGMLKNKDAVSSVGVHRPRPPCRDGGDPRRRKSGMGAGGALYSDGARRRHSWDAAPAEDLEEDAMLQLNAWARAHMRAKPRPRTLICGSLYLAGKNPG